MVKTTGKTAARGFTLIELVVVIVVLGILAAVALPKFMGLENQARVSTVSAMKGSLSSAVNMAYGVALATGQTGNPGTITVNGTTVTLIYGYPTNAWLAANPNGLIQDTSGFTVVAGNPVKFQKVGATTPASCAFTYAQPTAAGLAPVIQYVGAVPTTPPAASVC